MAEGKTSVIEKVKTPLGFFVLIVLIAEIVLSSSASSFPEYKSMILVAMIGLIFLLVFIVAFLAYCKPEALSGLRYSEDPELAKMRLSFQEVEHLANKITGAWTFTTYYQPEGEQKTVEVRGACEVRKGKYGVSMHGNCLDQEGKPGAAFAVKQVFMNEDGLTYIFEVPQDVGRATLGVGQVGFIRAAEESLITEMMGNWGVLGSKISGKVEFERKR